MRRNKEKTFYIIVWRDNEYKLVYILKDFLFNAKLSMQVYSVVLEDEKNKSVFILDSWNEHNSIVFGKNKLNNEVFFENKLIL